MKITKAEIVQDPQVITLPESWLPAWRQPSGEPVRQFKFSFYRLWTDDGITGVGPFTGADPAIARDLDPFLVEKFWNSPFDGPDTFVPQPGIAGLEIAMWDIIGKAANLPLYKLLGAWSDKILAYAATSRLLTPEAHVQQLKDLTSLGFRAVKLRLHRSDPADDLEVIKAIRREIGNDVILLVDANQSHIEDGYRRWSRSVALEVGKNLEQLNVFFLEEPLPVSDIQGLANLANDLDLPIAGGEHIPTPFRFKEHLLNHAYDILQPDIILGGRMGITGMKKTAVLAEHFGKQIIPHVLAGGKFLLSFAATIHVMGSVSNCPMMEFPYDPPILTQETCQAWTDTPFWIDESGFVRIPDRPGLGLELQS